MVALFWNYSENMATRKESLQRWRIWHSSKGLGGIVSWFCHCSQLTVPASYSLECLRGARGTSTERDVAREGPSSAPLEHPPPNQNDLPQLCWCRLQPIRSLLNTFHYTVRFLPSRHKDSCLQRSHSRWPSVLIKST